MRRRSAVWLAIGASLSACGGDAPQGAAAPEPVVTAATLGPQAVLTTAEYLAQERYATADAGNGAMQAQICRACHTLTADGANMVGPNLHGMFGSPAGKRGDFRYSAALASADFVWTPAALDAWLAQPARFLPGNLMSFPGVPDADDRDDLIAYLLDATRTAAPE